MIIVDARQSDRKRKKSGVQASINRKRLQEDNDQESRIKNQESRIKNQDVAQRRADH